MKKSDLTAVYFTRFKYRENKFKSQKPFKAVII